MDEPSSRAQAAARKLRSTAWQTRLRKHEQVEAIPSVRPEPQQSANELSTRRTFLHNHRHTRPGMSALLCTDKVRLAALAWFSISRGQEAIHARPAVYRQTSVRAQSLAGGRACICCQAVPLSVKLRLCSEVCSQIRLASSHVLCSLDWLALWPWPFGYLTADLLGLDRLTSRLEWPSLVALLTSRSSEVNIIYK